MKNVVKMTSKKSMKWTEEMQAVKPKSNKRDRRQARENKRNFDMF